MDRCVVIEVAFAVYVICMTSYERICIHVSTYNHVKYRIKNHFGNLELNAKEITFNLLNYKIDKM